MHMATGLPVLCQGKPTTCTVAPGATSLALLMTSDRLDSLFRSRRSSARLMWQLGSAWASTQRSPSLELSSLSLSSGFSI